MRHPATLAEVEILSLSTLIAIVKHSEQPRTGYVDVGFLRIISSCAVFVAVSCQ